MSDLAAAGRAGQNAFWDRRRTHAFDHGEDIDCENLARAVLESLGIEWDGEYEWRRIFDIGDDREPEIWYADEAMIRHPNSGAVQRRPKLTIRWEAG